ncbi:phage tail protein [Brevundimonas mediterranea]
MGGMGGAALKAGTAQVIGAFARMRMAAIAFNLSMLANPIVLGVVAAVAAVALIAVVVRKYWQPIKAFFGGVGQALGEAFGPALTAIGGALRPLKPLWDAVAGAVGGFFGWIGRLMQPMQATKGQLDGAANAGRNFGRIFVTIFNLSPIGLFARGLMGAFRLIRGAMNWRPMETLRNAWSGAGRVLQGVWSALRTTVSAGAAATVGIVARYHPIAILVRNWGPITGWVGGLWSRLTSTVSRGAASAVGVIVRYHPLAILARNWSPITGWLGGLWARLTSTVSAGAASAVGIVARYHPLAILVRNWGPITGWLGGLWARARGVITSGVQSAFASPLGFLAALPARFRNMGVQIIQGLARGITSGASAVVQAAVNAATSAAQGARHALGIRSPSRVFAQIGGFTMEGLAMGLNRNARQPLAALTALASAMAMTIPAEAAVAVRPAAAAPAAIDSAARTSSPVETLRMVLGSLEMARPASTAGQAASGGASREIHHHHRYGDITIQMHGANVTARDVARELGRQQQAQRRGAIHDDGAA